MNKANNGKSDKAYRDLILFLIHIKVIKPSQASDFIFLSAFRKGRAFRKGSSTFQELADLTRSFTDIDREEG